MTKGFCYPYLLSISWVSFKEKFYGNKEPKSFGTQYFASPVLLTKFGVSVSSFWSPGLIENLTTSYLPTVFLTLVLPRSLKKKQILKWNCFALICCLPNILLKKIHFNFMLLKHNLRWEILVYKLLTVQFEKIHNWHYWKYININIFNNVNLINNTYKYFFFKLLLRIFDVVWQLSPSTMQHELSNQDKRGNVNYNGSKLIDRWNVNKLTGMDYNGSRKITD